MLYFVAAGVCLHRILQARSPVLPSVTLALVLLGLQRLAHPQDMSSGSYAAWHLFIVLGVNLLVAFSLIMLVQRREKQSLQEARDSLVESQERYRDAMESSSDWMWEMDADLRFTYIGDRFTEVTGLDSGKFIGQTRQFVVYILFKMLNYGMS